MHINCKCGATIYDITDYLSYKAHFIPDQVWFELMESIDEVIEKTGSSNKDKESACNRVRSIIGKLSRRAWECHQCGRLYLEDQNHCVQEFIPHAEYIPGEIFRNRQPNVDPKE